MNATAPLVLEILSGPLDGEKITLTTTAEWSREGNGLLSFPWDVKLGLPSGRFVPEPGGWSVEPKDLFATISLITRDQKVTVAIRLVKGDILRAGTSWLRVL
jgi:hypothetical protein